MPRRVSSGTLQRLSGGWAVFGLVGMAGSSGVAFTEDLTVTLAARLLFIFIAGAACAACGAVVALLCVVKDNSADNAFWVGNLLNQAREMDDQRPARLRVVDTPLRAPDR